VLDESGYPIDHSIMRFRKVIEVERIPKPEAPMELTTTAGMAIPARVVRADWNEGRGMFIVSCQYANRSITPEEYAALANDPEWELKHLLD
jgi:hypothetical protein